MFFTALRLYWGNGQTVQIFFPYKLFLMNERHLSWSLSLIEIVGTFWFLHWVPTSPVSSCLPCCGHDYSDNSSVVELAFSQDSLSMMFWNRVALFLLYRCYFWMSFVSLPVVFFPLFKRCIFFCQVFRSHLSISSVSDQDASRAGLQPVSRWKAYGLNGYPGRYLLISRKISRNFIASHSGIFHLIFLVLPKKSILVCLSII